MLIWAQILAAMREYKAAEELCRQAMEEQEEILGKRHPDTLCTRGNLAWILQNQCKYTEAAESHR